MKKNELIQDLSDKSGLAKKDVEAFLSALTETVEQRVMQDDKIVRITGLGTFKRIDVMARKARNPRTGEEVAVPATQRLTFKVAAGMKRKG